jgi:ubiquitin-protein ligase
MLGLGKKKEKKDKDVKKEVKKDKKEKKVKKSSTKTSAADKAPVAKKVRDPTGKVFLPALKEWLASSKNSEHIEYVKTDEEEHRFHFTVGDEKLNFEVTFPVEPEDVWCVSSDDLSEDWVNNTLEFVMESKNIGEVLMYCTQQFSALSDEELSDGDEDEDEEDEDDGFDDDVFGKVEKGGPKKTYTPEPQIDTSKFIIPAGYEPGGVQAIIQQYRDILKTSREERGYDAAPLNDNIAQWEVKLFSIPKDEPLYQDMKQLGLEHLTLHVTFPPNFPFSPPFIRVVRPRFAFRTGHVTLGGSICTLMLTNDGWIATYRLDQVMVDIAAMLTSGGGRLDLSNRSDYSEEEAMVAFRRMLDTHGWKHWKQA